MFDSKNFIAANVRSIPRSGIRDFFDIVQGMKDVISLGVGEPDFVTPWHIREAAIYALERGKTSYTSNLGLLRLREAIVKHVAEKFGIQYDAKNQIIIAVGVSEAMDAAPEEWGEARLVPLVRAARREPPATLITRIMAGADAFVNGAPQHDDMTLVVMRCV